MRIDKEFAGRRPRTWVSLTPHGQQAMRQHLEALEALVRAARRTPTGGLSPSASKRDEEAD